MKSGYLGPVLCIAGSLLAGRAPASDYMATQREQARLLASEEKSPAEKSLGLGLPAPIAGSPEYLVRVIYIMPTDRQPSDPLQYEAKVNSMTAKIRGAVEAVNDFYVAEQERYGISIPGKPMNLERELTGEVRVIVLNGTRPTTGATGYWGDAVGFNSGSISYISQLEIFGSVANATAACAKNTFIIFPDTFAVDGSGPTPVYRGYLGLGASGGTAGAGGLSYMAAGVLEPMLEPASTSEADRIAALQATLCSSDTSFTSGAYTGVFFGDPPACAASRNLMRGEWVSIYLGVLAHETLHGFRIVHDSYTADGLMGSGYTRLGASLREIHSMPACGAAPLVNPPFCKRTMLGEPFTNFIAHNSFFNAAVEADKTDPTMDIAWPPNGHFFGVEAAQENDSYPFIELADGGSGTPLNLGLFYDRGGLFDNELFGGSGRVQADFNDFPFDKFVGIRRMDIVATDMAGNIREMPVDAFGMIYTAAEMGTSWNNTFWVRRPAGEDTRSRNAGSPLGTFNNPYSDIQTALTAAKASGYGTVLIGEGVWPLSTPLSSGPRINISGEGVGKTILDGGGTAAALILSDSNPSLLRECTISNLVFCNAAVGVQKNYFQTNYHYALTNCIFYNITGRAIDITGNRGNFEISGLTIVNCGTGLYLTDYQQFSASDRLIFRNNIVAGCTGEGIRLDSTQNLYTSAYTGYNIAHNNGTNFAGTGDGTLSYTANRLPEELASDPQFIAYPPTTPIDLKLNGSSPGFRTGHPSNENADGTRRDRGAYINTPMGAAIEEWFVVGE